ncbi:MAG: hypothetical protein WBX03_08180 [Terriglobales bacterium]
MDDTLKKAHKLTRELAAAIGMAKDFAAVKKAVLDYVEYMDTYTHILGDGDLMAMTQAAMKRRGKNSHAFAEGRWIYDIWCTIGKPKEGIRIDGVLYTVERCEALANATELRGLTNRAAKAGQ